MNEIRLIACDMDGTLLDSRKRLPPELPRVVRALKEKGIRFAVASGRQYAALLKDLKEVADDILFICENGSNVMDRGQRILLDPMEPDTVPEIIRAAHELGGVYPLICRADKVLIESNVGEGFIEATHTYYPSWELVKDFGDLPELEDVCKIAVYDLGDAETHEYPVLREKLGGKLSVILSGDKWVDIMKPGVDKGHAMQRLQSIMGITADQCMAFGDYLNDCELLASVTESYCMENGHPDLKARSKYIAPSNDENGVMRVICERFGL